MAAQNPTTGLFLRHGGALGPNPPDAARGGCAPPALTQGAGLAGADRSAVAARAAIVAERRRLARDLHDSVTQTLIGLQLTAQAAADLWDSQPAQARAALDTLRSLAAGAATELRAVLLDLHDAVLEQQGLVAALAAYCAVVRQRSGLQVEVHIQEPGPGTQLGTQRHGGRLPAGHEEAVYRLVQEALANVIKHARAIRATVTLVLDTPLRVCVEDDGVGFGAPPSAFSYGLTGMHERVTALGGRLYLGNGPAGGARVIAEIPVSNHAPPSRRPALAHGRAGGSPAAWPAREAGQ